MKKKKTAIILAFFLGGIGVHHFYLNQPLRGVAYLLFSLTLVPILLSYFDILVLLFMSDQRFEAKYNTPQSLSRQPSSLPQKKTNGQYNPISITTTTIQFLESCYILSNTKNIDTLIGRYNFILTIYPSLEASSNHQRFLSDVQNGIDQYKTLYYERIPSELDLKLILKPDRNILTNFYSECLNLCFYRFFEDQQSQINSLKRNDAKERRKNKIIDVCKIAIRELTQRGAQNAKYEGYISNLKKILFELDPDSTMIDEAEQTSKSYVLNKDSKFPLTLYGADNFIFEKIQQVLDDQNTWNKKSKLTPLFSEYNIKCKEIEEYIFKYKPAYTSAINTLKLNHAEYKDALELDRIDIENELKTIVIDQLWERADCKLDRLFDNSEISATIDDPLIQRYGYGPLSKYFSLQHQKGKIISNWDRNDFEDLVTADLVYTVDDIDVNEILLAQSLKTLNAICEKEEGFFKRKNKAVAYLDENPRLFQNIGKHIVTRKLFKLKPLPKEFENINLEEIQAHWAFLEEYVQLLVDTYDQAKNTQERITANKGWVTSYSVSCHEEYNSNFVCLRAREEAKKKYSKSKAPSIPFHIGCNCHLEEKY